MIEFPENTTIQIKDQVNRVWLKFFLAVNNACFAVYQSGITANRPVGTLWIGRNYFDTTLGYMIWYNGTVWVNSAGAPV